MTTRVLASFDALDKYSKEVLSRHSRRNKLSHGEQCATFDELLSPCGVADDWELYPTGDRETSKSKLSTDITKVKSHPKHSKAKSTRHQQSRSAQKVCSKVNICDDVSRRPEDRDEKRESSVGFMVVRIPRTPSVVFRKYMQHRPKWSSEVERSASIYSSRALTRGAYSSTSYRSSTSSSGSKRPVSAFTDEENGPFTLTGSVGKDVTGQVEHGDTVRVTASGRRSEDIYDTDQLCGKKEPQPLPLCLEDELKRHPSKVLSPRASTAYTPLSIVSETFPVVYNAGQPHNKPHSSKGFHTLDPPDAPPRSGTYLEDYDRGSKIHSAIIRLTDNIQEQHAARFQRRASTAKWRLQEYLAASVDTIFKPIEQHPEHANLRALTQNPGSPAPSNPKTTALDLINLKPLPGPPGLPGTVNNGVNPKTIGMSQINITLPSCDDRSLPIIHGHPRTKVLARKTTDSAPVMKSGSFLIANPLLQLNGYPCIFAPTQTKTVPVAANFGSVHGSSIGLLAPRPSRISIAEVPCLARNTPISDETKDGAAALNIHFTETRIMTIS